MSKLLLTLTGVDVVVAVYCFPSLHRASAENVEKCSYIVSYKENDAEKSYGEPTPRTPAVETADANAHTVSSEKSPAVPAAVSPVPLPHALEFVDDAEPGIASVSSHS